MKIKTNVRAGYDLDNPVGPDFPGGGGVGGGGGTGGRCAPVPRCGGSTTYYY